MAMPAKQKALRKIIREGPCGLTALARAAGVPQPNLHNAANGIRPVSDGMATRVVAALRDWAERCHRLANEMEAATKGESR